MSNISNYEIEKLEMTHLGILKQPTKIIKQITCVRNIYMYLGTINHKHIYWNENTRHYDEKKFFFNDNYLGDYIVLKDNEFKKKVNSDDLNSYATQMEELEKRIEDESYNYRISQFERGTSKEELPVDVDKFFKKKNAELDNILKQIITDKIKEEKKEKEREKKEAEEEEERKKLAKKGILKFTGTSVERNKRFVFEEGNNIKFSKKIPVEDEHAIMGEGYDNKIYLKKRHYSSDDIREKIIKLALEHKKDFFIETESKNIKIGFIKGRFQINGLSCNKNYATKIISFLEKEPNTKDEKLKDRIKQYSSLGIIKNKLLEINSIKIPSVGVKEKSVELSIDIDSESVEKASVCIGKISKKDICWEVVKDCFTSGRSERNHFYGLTDLSKLGFSKEELFKEIQKELINQEL